MEAIQRATVTGFNAAGVAVRVHEQGTRYEQVPILEGIWTDAVITDTTAAHSHHPARALEVGDIVVVGFLGGRPNDPVILGRLH